MSSKPHVKTPPAQTPAGTDQAQDAAPTPTGAPDAALVQPTQASATPAFEDPHRGQGGVFVIQSGVTQPIEGPALAPASPTASKE